MTAMMGAPDTLSVKGTVSSNAKQCELPLGLPLMLSGHVESNLCMWPVKLSCAYASDKSSRMFPTPLAITDRSLKCHCWICMQREKGSAQQCFWPISGDWFIVTVCCILWFDCVGMLRVHELKEMNLVKEFGNYLKKDTLWLAESTGSCKMKCHTGISNCSGRKDIHLL